MRRPLRRVNQVSARQLCSEEYDFNNLRIYGIPVPLAGTSTGSTNYSKETHVQLPTSNRRTRKYHTESSPVEHQNRHSTIDAAATAHPKPTDTFSRFSVTGRGTDNPNFSQPIDRDERSFASPPDQLPTQTSFRNDSSDVETSPQSHVELAPEQSMDTTLILQWNINGLSNNLADLELLVYKHQPHAIVLQEPRNSDETWLNRILGGKYSWIVKPNANIYRTVALGIKNTTPSVPVTLDTDLSIVAARLELPVPFTVVCGYLPHGPWP